MTSQQKDILTTKMFDSPQTLTNEEIECILADKELLELYQTAVLYKDSKPSDTTYDMDKEWSQISQKLGLESEYAIYATIQKDKTNPTGATQSTRSISSSSTSSSIFSIAFWKQNQWRKYAAVIAIFISITAIAAITTHYVVNQNQKLAQNEPHELYSDKPNSEVIISKEPEDIPTLAVLQSEKIFEGATLDEIAKELSEAFEVGIEVDDSVKDVRLYLRLPQGSSVEDLLTVLGQYDSLSVNRNSDGNIFIGHGE